MADKKDALAVRLAQKKRKPAFVVKESSFSARVKKRWRFPRGKHSKVRQMHKGRNALPNPGYGAPKLVRGVDAKSGLYPVVIASEKDLLAVDKASQGVLLSAKLGIRRKIVLIQKVQELGLTLLNIKDPAAYVRGAQKAVQERKTAGKERSAAKQKRDAKAAAAAEAQKKEEKSAPDVSKEEKQTKQADKPKKSESKSEASKVEAKKEVKKEVKTEGASQ